MKLRVIYPDYYPMNNVNCSTFSSTRYCRMPGLAVEIIRLIAKEMNATIEGVHYDRRFTINDILDKDGRFTGMYAQMQNEDADLIALPREITEHRIKYWDFTAPLYQSETYVAFRMEDTTLWSVFDFFHVYGEYTWFFMMLTFVVFTGFGAIVRVVERRFDLCYPTNFYTHCWRYLRLQLLQPVDIQYRLSAGNISLVVFALLQCALIVSLYQSWILTSVVRVRVPPKLTFENIKQLLLDGRYELASADPHSWYFEEIYKSSVEPYYSFRLALTNREPRWVESDFAALRLASNGDYMVFLQTDRQDRYLAHRFCELTSVQSPFYPSAESFFMRKNHSLLPAINQAINVQTHRIQRLYQKYTAYRTPTECSKPNYNVKPLTLTPYYGVVLLLAFGLICAFFLFIIELVFGTHQPHDPTSGHPVYQ